jgi:hypothetical protein
MKKLILLISLLVFVFSFSAVAATKVAQTGCGFLDVSAGARAVGMGEAFTVLGQDATALFYNPSGIGKIDGKFDLSVGGTQWISEIQYLYMAAVYDADVWGNLGFSVIYPDYGDIYGTKVVEGGTGFEETGMLDVSAFCAGIAYAREFTDKFTIGGQVKYVAQNLGSNLFEEIGEETVDTVSRENKISTLSYDFGLLFYPGFKSFAFGMSVRNFSPRVTYERIGFELPLTFALGVGMDILDLFGEYPDYSLNIGLEGLHPRDWDEQYHVCGEFSYKGMLFLRAGYKFNYYLEDLNAGLGISVAGVKIDYSYSRVKLYDFVNRVSAGFTF